MNATRFIRRLALFCFLILASLANAALAADTMPVATRLALLEVGSDPRLQNIRDLAEAQMAQGGQIQVLERQSVERLLAEQRLSLSDLVSADQAIQVGKVLSADLLVIVESDPASQGAGIVVFDPAAGVRLWDSAFAIDDGVKAADLLVRSINDAVLKRSKKTSLHTACLLTVRNADLPHGLDGLCDAVGRLFERNLVRSSSVALLERSRLDAVERERAISTNASLHDLAASLILIELEVDRGQGGDALRAVAFLTDGAGNRIGTLTASVKEQDAVALSTAITDAFNNQFRVTSGGKIDRAAEAARFARESQFRGNSADLVRAVACAEAAHALAPESVRYRALLARNLILLATARENAPTATSSLLDRTSMNSALVRGAATVADIFPLSSNAIDRSLLADAANQLRAYVNTSESKRLSAGGNTAPPEDIAKAMESLRCCLFAEDAERCAAVNRPESVDFYGYHLTVLVNDMWVCSSASEWAQDHRQHAQKWLALHEKYPGCDEHTRQALRAIAVGWQPDLYFHAPRLDPIKHSRKPSAADYARLDDLCGIMRASTDFTVRAYGDLLGLAIAVTKVDTSPEAMKQCVDDYIARMKLELVRPEFENHPEVKDLYYELMGIADQMLALTPYAWKNSIELLDFSLDRNEIQSLIVSNGVYGGIPIGWRYKCSARERARRVAAIERVLKVFDSADCKRLSAKFPDAIYRRSLLVYKDASGDSHADISATKPWTQNRQLIDLIEAANGLEWIMSPVVAGDSVYVLASTKAKPHGEGRSQLLRLACDGGAIQPLASLPTNFPLNKLPKSKTRGPFSGFVNPGDPDIFIPACISEGYYCAATARNGILIFPINGGPARQIDEKNGLPASSAQAATVFNQKVYAGLTAAGHRSYIVSYDLASKQVEVLASNARKDKRSPFDDGSAFTVCGLFADAPRQRLIVIIQRSEETTQVNGIWEYKPETGRWRDLAPMRLWLPGDDAQIASWDSKISQTYRSSDRQIHIFTGRTVYSFDPVSDTAVTVLELPSRAPRPLAPDTPALKSTTPQGASAAFQLVRSLDGVLAFSEPYLYTGLYRAPWGRVNLTTGQIERFASPRNRYPFGACWIEPIENGDRILVCDAYGLWILPFPKGGGDHPATNP